MTNTHTVNWCSCHPGNAFIPGFGERYCISDDGQVISHTPYGTFVVLRPVPAKEYLEKRGGERGTYWRYGLYDGTHVKPKMYSRHRLVILTFKGKDPNPERNVVNHINGIKGDDRVVNLEWLTNQENIEHAFQEGLRPDKIRPVEVLDVKTGKTELYGSVNQFCKATNTPVGTIRKRLNKDNAMVYDGKRYRHTDQEWSTTDVQYFTDRLKTNERAVTVYDLRDGSFKDYPSAKSVADKYGSTSVMIAQAIRGKHLSPMYGCFFRDAGTEWFPQPTEHQLRLLKKMNYPDAMPVGCALFKDSLDNEVFMGTYEEVMEYLGLSATGTIRNAANKGVLLRGYALAKIGKLVHPDDVIRRQP